MIADTKCRYYLNGLALTTRHASRLDFLSSSIFSKRGLFDRILSSASHSGGKSSSQVSKN